MPLDNLLTELRGRGFQRRAAHAIGFELGFIIMLVPLFAWWLGIGWWHALVFFFFVSAFFVFYTFAFNLAFDKVFGLPLSAQ